MYTMNLIGKIFDTFKIALSLSSHKQNSPTIKPRLSINGSHIEGYVEQTSGNKYHTEVTMNDDVASNIEKQIIKYLHVHGNRTNGPPSKKLYALYKDLEIDGDTWLGPVHDSRFIKVNTLNAHLTTDGVRYADNMRPEDLSAIVLPDERREMEMAQEKQQVRWSRNRERNHLNSAR